MINIGNDLCKVLNVYSRNDIFKVNIFNGYTSIFRPHVTCCRSYAVTFMLNFAFTFCDFVKPYVARIYFRVLIGENLKNCH